MELKRCYAHPPAGVDISGLSGALIVIEGPDSSGRSSHIRSLASWLTQNGYPVAEVGLRRSELVGRELERAKEGNLLSPRTRSLFYATDFYDQLENRILPALRAGSVVLADRYIYTLMARDLVRGAEMSWLESLYSMALVPDAVFYLTVSTRNLVERTLEVHAQLNYWESGMDLGLSRDWHESFERYQRRMRHEFNQLRERYQFEMVDANRRFENVDRDLRQRIENALRKRYLAHPPSVDSMTLPTPWKVWSAAASFEP